MASGVLEKVLLGPHRLPWWSPLQCDNGLGALAVTSMTRTKHQRVLRQGTLWVTRRGLRWGRQARARG